MTAGAKILMTSLMMRATRSPLEPQSQEVPKNLKYGIHCADRYLLMPRARRAQILDVRADKLT